MNKEPSPGVISSVVPGSPADAAGIEPGDKVLSIAGQTPRDVVDMRFYQADEEVAVLFEKANGLQDYVLFEKEIDEDLGLEFEHATWDDVILCNNNCFFCFLKGLPKGMRKSLYLKDDDYRLSFLHGNFVTLTNLTEDDWARIEEQRLSPLNISVHATELELRRSMLSNPNAPDILEQIARLRTLGIEAHTQIVLCPGVNDGAHLERSVLDLAALQPAVRSISIVPVGASPKLEDWSRERDGIELVRPTREYAREIVNLVRPLQKRLRAEHGRTIVHCADEYYVTAGERVPGAAAYEGYGQYENGIGMVRTMLEDWARTRSRLKRSGERFDGQAVTIASGTLIAPALAEVGEELAELTGARVRVVPVTNTAFGERVKVSGLLCGHDIIRAVQDVDAGIIALPRPSLDYFGRRFLDSITVNELRERVSAPVVFASQWSEVVEALRGSRPEPGRLPVTNGAFWSEEREKVPAGGSWVPA